MKKRIIILSTIFVAFIIFTVLAKVVDVTAINGVEVGFSSLNKALLTNNGQENELMHKLGHALLFFSLAVLLVLFIIAVFYFFKDKKYFKGIPSFFYALLISGILLTIFYIVFGKLLVINHRPLGDGKPSYPSTHILVTSFIALSFTYYLKTLSCKKLYLNLSLIASIIIIVAQFMFRYLSNRHWFTDCIGALLLSLSLVGLTVILTVVFNKKRI